MPEKTKTPKRERLQSLDALRGFDMFWIMGGEHIIIAISALTSIPLFEWAAAQMHHVEWHGFRAYDMIFPLFLFIAGISFTFSMTKRLANGDKKGLYNHVLKRGLLLVLIGIIYNNGVQFDFANMRYASVLGRIGLAWMFAALIFMNAKLRWQIIWLIVILVSYWGIMAFFSAPDFGDPDHYSMKGNIASYVDRILLPGKFCCYEYGDNEGILSTFPAIGTALMGMLTGKFLMRQQEQPMTKVIYIAAAGALLVVIGLVWDLSMPINKNLWSSSFVCLVGGLSLLLFALFYLIMDVWKIRKWAFPLIVIGMNPLTIYLAQTVFDFGHTNKFFFGGLANLFPEGWNHLILAIGYVAVSWVFLYILYKKKVFIKL